MKASTLWIALCTALLLMATACSHKAITSPYTVLADHLHTPWAIEFNGDVIYLTEREGSIVKISNNSATRQQVKLAKPVKSYGEGGLLGFMIAPDFASSRQAYTYHTYEEDGKTWNRVVLLREAPTGWQEVKALLERIPGGVIHNGGRLAIGPDNNLYITTGESGQDRLAQDLQSLGGKILRMALDGRVPADNPFPGSYVYSYGHRNSQGIAWDRQGRMYSSEHGPSGNPGGHDEINRIEPGRNYGWPDIIGDAKKPGMVSPLYHTGDIAIAPSGIAIDTDNNIWVATLRGEKLIKFNPVGGQLDTMLEKEGRLRDVKLHKGAVYVITNNTDGRGKPSATDDRLIRFIP